MHQSSSDKNTSLARERKLAYEQLRRKSTWRLLSANKAPAVLAILQSVFPAAERRLERSELTARVDSHLDLLITEEQSTTAADYIDAWVREGYLTRRDDPLSLETTFEPSAASVEAIQFILSLQEYRPTTTESRLSLVMQQFELLADETETDTQLRLKSLQRRREQIEKEIAQLSTGNFFFPPTEHSADRLRDILQIADELSSDFLQYREDLRAVDLHIREQILSPDGSRGEILEQLLAGDDLLGQSPVGKTFGAFFKLLNDPAQNERAQDVIDRLLERDFARALSRKDRERLANVFSDLYEPAQEVLDVKTELYRSLARFVRSQDFRQHRVLMDLLQTAQGIALSQKDAVSHRLIEDIELTLSRAQFNSVSQLALKDPSDPGVPEVAEIHDTTVLNLEVLDELVKTNDIDLVGLTKAVNAEIAARGQGSVGSIAKRTNTPQGLASIIGLMFLATQYGQKLEGDVEFLTWVESPDLANTSQAQSKEINSLNPASAAQSVSPKRYAAKIPAFYFFEAIPEL